MSDRMYTNVTAFNPWYDEQSEARIYNILDKKICFKHDWVNASLRWEKNGYHVDLKPQKVVVGNEESTEWGFYGKFRFCKKCKKIDCIHYLDDTKELRRWINAVDYDYALLQHCKRCDKWIYVSGCCVINSYAIDKKGVECGL